jgi:hypothetical protein
MAAIDYTDFYILDKYYNKFNESELVEDEVIRLIIQKYQMLVYTSNGDVMGDYNFGTNLIELLYETKLDADSVQEVMEFQIKNYIPEITNTPFSISVTFEQDPSNYQDIMFIEFKIDEFTIVNQIGNFL